MDLVIGVVFLCGYYEPSVVGLTGSCNAVQFPVRSDKVGVIITPSERGCFLCYDFGYAKQFSVHCAELIHETHTTPFVGGEVKV